MRAVVQRVSKASVSVDGNIIGAVNRGLMILIAVKNGDTETDAKFLAEKIPNLRIFEDEQGKINISAHDAGAELLVVSQFTLYGDCRRGRRPSFTDAAPPEVSEGLYKKFVSFLNKSGLKVEEGEFGGRMLVEIHNDGPVTLIIESPSHDD